MKESNHRDRAEMQLAADEHVKAVLEFMQDNVPIAKLIGIAESLPQMARLLWGHYPQEPCVSLRLMLAKTAEPSPSPQASTESFLVKAGERGDSEEVKTCR
jgi:hypothetical protein